MARLGRTLISCQPPRGRSVLTIIRPRHRALFLFTSELCSHAAAGFGPHPLSPEFVTRTRHFHTADFARPTLSDGVKTPRLTPHLASRVVGKSSTPRT